jgi:exosortase A-associated hydrolase 2
MSSAVARPGARGAHHGGLQPFFLEATRGRLFCLLHEPPRSDARALAPVLFLPPFAEEMNKSRRMISLHARALAAAGHRVLIPDLYGTGDSEGDFADARWETWIEDLALLRRWLEERDGLSPSFWSLRTGALLGVDLIAADANGMQATAGHRQAAAVPPQWLLWQPVVNGQQFLTQFLRLKVAAQMTGTGAPADSKALRAQLSAGSSVEIAGYELPGSLALALDSKTLSAAILSRAPRAGWFEITTSATPSLTPVAKKVIEECRARGASIEAHAIQGQPFWSTPEITLVPELLQASARFAAGQEVAPVATGSEGRANGGAS